MVSKTKTTMKKTHYSPSHFRKGFTLIELLTVIAIIGILAAILIPVVGSVRKSARLTQTASNLRQIGTGIQLYMNDNNNELPGRSGVTGNGSPRGLQAYVPASFSFPGGDNDRRNLAYHIAPYLQELRNGENTVEVLLDPLTRSESRNPAGKYMSVWALNHILSPGRTYPQLTQTVHPFGLGWGASGPVSYSIFGTLLNPSLTWAVISADQKLGETSNHAVGSFKDGPAEPVGGSYRYALFFDWSIGQIPVQTDLTTEVPR